MMACGSCRQRAGILIAVGCESRSTASSVRLPGSAGVSPAKWNQIVAKQRAGGTPALPGSKRSVCIPQHFFRSPSKPIRHFPFLVKNVSRRFNKSGLHPSQVPVEFLTQAELFWCRRIVEVQTQPCWQSNRCQTGGFQNRPRPAFRFQFPKQSFY